MYQDALQKSDVTEQLKCTVSSNNTEQHRWEEMAGKKNYLVQSTVFNEYKNQYR